VVSSGGVVVGQTPGVDGAAEPVGGDGSAPSARGDAAAEPLSDGDGPDDLWPEGGGESDDGDSAGSRLGKSGAGGFDSADRSGDLGGDEDDAEGSAVEERS
jgi:hypothetical protein